MGRGKVSMKEDLCGNMVLGRLLCSHPQRGQKQGTGSSASVQACGGMAVPAGVLKVPEQLRGPSQWSP